MESQSLCFAFQDLVQDFVIFVCSETRNAVYYVISLDVSVLRYERASTVYKLFINYGKKF